MIPKKWTILRYYIKPQITNEMLTAVVKGKNCKTVAIVILLGLPEPIKSNLMVCAVNLADKGIHIQFKAHPSWHSQTDIRFVNVS